MQIVFCDHLHCYASQNQSLPCWRSHETAWISIVLACVFPSFFLLTCIFGHNSNRYQENMLLFLSVLWMIQRKLHHAGDKSSKWESWRTLAVGWRLSQGHIWRFLLSGYCGDREESSWGSMIVFSSDILDSWFSPRENEIQPCLTSISPFIPRGKS